MRNTFAAQIYGQLVTIFMQLAAAPFLISIWGAEGYGKWLFISTIPQYLSYSDFGVTFIAKNSMSIKAIQGDKAGAVEIYRSAMAVLIGTLVALALISVLLSVFCSFPSLEKVVGKSEMHDALIAVLLQGLSAVFYQFLMLECAAVRASGKPALEVVIAATARLFDVVAMVFAANSYDNFAVTSFVMLLVRVVYYVIVLMLPNSLMSIADRRPKLVDMGKISQLLQSSVFYMGIPLSAVILIQGPVYLIGLREGAVAVALYSTSRTIARTGVSLTNVLSFTFAPQYSYAFGRDDRVAISRLFCRHAFATLVFCAIYLLGAVVFGEDALNVLGRGQLHMDKYIMAALIVGVLVEIGWNLLFAPHSARNAVAGVGLFSFAFAVTLIVFGGALTSLYSIACIPVAANLAILVFVAMRFRMSPLNLETMSAR